LFEQFLTSHKYKPIRTFIDQLNREIIQRLQLNGKIKHEFIDFQGRPHSGAIKFSLAIYKSSQSQFAPLQLLVEFQDCMIKYGIKRQNEKNYTKGPEERNSANFDFESLISFFEENKELILKNEPSENMENVLPKFPCNIILYGPPGTGKTYNTIDLAVEIVTGKNSTHEENKKVFDDLRKEGQIEFITFHQNYSYEDFMTGIRPDLEEASTLRFRRKEGIFYKICKRAEQNYLQSKNKKNALRPFKEVFSEFIEPLEKEETEIEIKMISGKSSFWITEINPNNLGFRKQSGGTNHTLCIDTIQGLYEETREFSSGLRSYYEPLIKELWRRGKQTTSEVKLNRYVLIIDEINRANISKVFGELITLLEEDKRIGAKNELRISIPGEETGFGIPPNVYVIGTMNTADKSIAMIDIALRRRFEFRGYFPDYNNVDEISGNILKHINKKIYERKKSADYLIGHGYFMNGGEPPETFKVLQNKVIPLLMEYFSGKTEVVEDIFNGSHWSVKYDTEKYSWEIEPQTKL
jgi:5-methylcytosine-specific restriction enzyme B